MWHRIEFRYRLCLKLEVPHSNYYQRLKVGKGCRCMVQVKPYHQDSREVADLFFEDGTTARGISFGLFRFVES